MKTCSKCKVAKPKAEFRKETRHKDGLRSSCRICDQAYYKDYYAKNKKKKLLANKQYRERNPEKFKASCLAWEEKNEDYRREYRAKYMKTRRQSDLQFKLADNLRTRLGMAVKNKSKTGSAVRDLGCSIDFLIDYLSKQFEPGMSWENHGIHGWHIDHIVPLSSFDLTDSEQVKQACHYTNLQPLWAKENIAKKDKIDQEG